MNILKINLQTLIEDKTLPPEQQLSVDQILILKDGSIVKPTKIKHLAWEWFGRFDSFKEYLGVNNKELKQLLEKEEEHNPIAKRNKEYLQMIGRISLDDSVSAQDKPEKIQELQKKIRAAADEILKTRQ